MLNQFSESGLYLGRNDDFCTAEVQKLEFTLVADGACPREDTGVGDYVS